MKKFNLLLFASLLTSIVIGQNNDYFEEIPGTPFDGVYSGSVAFADIDNDNDQDVLITGNSSSGQPIAKLYRNITVSTGDIERNTLLNSVSIYPNPNRGLVNINLGSLTDVSVKVLNLSGNLIRGIEGLNELKSLEELDLSGNIRILERYKKYVAKIEKSGFNVVSSMSGIDDIFKLVKFINNSRL